MRELASANEESGANVAQPSSANAQNASQAKPAIPTTLTELCEQLMTWQAEWSASAGAGQPARSVSGSDVELLRSLLARMSSEGQGGRDARREDEGKAAAPSPIEENGHGNGKLHR